MARAVQWASGPGVPAARRYWVEPRAVSPQRTQGPQSSAEGTKCSAPPPRAGSRPTPSPRLCVSAGDSAAESREHPRCDPAETRRRRGPNQEQREAYSKRTGSREAGKSAKSVAPVANSFAASREPLNTTSRSSRTPDRCTLCVLRVSAVNSLKNGRMAGCRSPWHGVTPQAGEPSGPPGRRGERPGEWTVSRSGATGILGPASRPCRCGGATIGWLG